MQNYDLFIEKIIKTTGLKREEVEERVEKKKEIKLFERVLTPRSPPDRQS